jgi:hypothetical protein
MREKAGEAVGKLADVTQQAGSQAKQTASSLSADANQKAKGFCRQASSRQLNVRRASARTSMPNTMPEVTPYSRYAAWVRNRLCLELLVIWRVQRVIGDANVEPVVCVIVSGGPIWVGDAECDRASINAIGGRGRLGSIRGTSYWN